MTFMPDGQQDQGTMQQGTASQVAQGAGTGATAALPAAGWYPDHSDASLLRYWDGAAWTEHTAPAQAPAQPAAAQPAVAQPGYAQQTAQPIHAGYTSETNYGAQAAYVAQPGYAAQPMAYAPATPTRKRWSKGAIALTVVGAVAVVSGLGAGAVMLWGGGLTDTFVSIANGDSGARELTAAAEDTWVTISLADGSGTFAVDPEWERIDDFAQAAFGSSAESAEYSDTIAGAWLTSGDLVNGGSILMVMNHVEDGTAAVPKFVVESFMDGAVGTAGSESVTEGDSGPVLTASGYSGYVTEFDVAVDDITASMAVGAVVDGSNQVIVYATALPGEEPASTVVEQAMNSLDLSE